MKKIVISLLFLLLLTGCWNYKELNNYSIVTGIAIDKGKHEGEYEVSVLISNSSNSNDSNSNSSESQIVVYSGTGETIYTSLKQIALSSPKELYFGHFSILIISEDIAKDGVNNIIDFFLRYTNSKKNFYINISKGNKAKDTLKIITPLSDFPSQNITDNLISTSELQGVISKVNFNEFLSKLERTGVENIINSIEIVGNTKEGSSKENTEVSEPKAYIKLGNLGIFKNDKLITWTDDYQSVGINIINNKLNEMYLFVNEDNAKIVINAIELNTDIKVNVKNNIPLVNISTKGETKIVEVIGNVDLSNNETLKSINKKINEEFNSYIDKAIKVAIENKSDIFGFGLKFYQNYPDFYKNIEKNWEDNLSKIKITIKTDIPLKTRGSAQNSLEDINDKKENN